MASTEDKEKKQKVLHTRIPESLDDEIRQRSERLGISVSNLVRNVLQNAFGLVEGIVADSANIARSARGDTATGAGAGAAGDATATAPTASARPSGGPTLGGGVLGWNEAVLNVNAVCAECNGILPRGDRAAIGIVAGAAAPPIVCPTCLATLLKEQPKHDDTNPDRDD